MILKIQKDCKTGTTEEALAQAEKIGFDTGLNVKHPFINDLKLHIANFVLMDYNGAIWMSCT